MRKIREVLRLKHDLDLSEREIAQSCRVGKGTVGNYLKRAGQAGLGWPLPEGIDDRALEALLFPQSSPLPQCSKETPTGVGVRVEEDGGGVFGSDADDLAKATENTADRSNPCVSPPPPPSRYPLPDWNHIQSELESHKGVTRKLLWEEYARQFPEGHYCYSVFTIKFREWRRGRKVTMRLDHEPGRKLFVDYAGVTLGITNPSTGEVSSAQIFVATLGASNYTFCEATESQGLADWLGSHRRAFEYFGGVPQILVPDNIKTGIRKACYYEPDLNISYAELAEHYGCAVIPARVRKPRDKAKVETGVQIIERQILAPLRNRTFFSLVEANEAIRTLLDDLNHKPFQKLPGSRRSVFMQHEKSALLPLPQQPYVLSQWKKAKVNIDYHIEVDGHYYSVPYRYAHKSVELRLTQNTVEVFFEGQRIAAHRRVADLLQYRGRHTTINEHMPKAHQRYGDWSPQRLILWAEKTGPYTAKVVEEILKSRPHPEQGYRSCMGLLRLGKTYSSERLEAACRRAFHIRAFRYKSVESILQNRLDAEPLEMNTPEQDKQQSKTSQPTLHANVRGPGYYN